MFCKNLKWVTWVLRCKMMLMKKKMKGIKVTLRSSLHATYVFHEWIRKFYELEAVRTTFEKTFGQTVVLFQTCMICRFGQSKDLNSNYFNNLKQQTGHFNRPNHINCRRSSHKKSTLSHQLSLFFYIWKNYKEDENYVYEKIFIVQAWICSLGLMRLKETIFF